MPQAATVTAGNNQAPEAAGDFGRWSPDRSELGVLGGKEADLRSSPCKWGAGAATWPREICFFYWEKNLTKPYR